MDDIGLDAHERTGEPEYDPWWDDERMSAAMFGGWYALRQTRQGINWMEQDDPPTDAGGREDVGR